MLKIYCSDCGSPTNYAGNKPKFCSNCGSPFEKSLNIQKPLPKELPKKEVPKVVKSTYIEDEEDFYDDEEVNHVPEINKLDCDIIESSSRGEKLSNLLGTLDNSGRSESSQKGNKKLSKQDRKKFLEDFSKEAGAIKPKTRIRKNAP
jgi:hypothetical protein